MGGDAATALPFEDPPLLEATARQARMRMIPFYPVTESQSVKHKPVSGRDRHVRLEGLPFSFQIRPNPSISFEDDPYYKV